MPHETSRALKKNEFEQIIEICRNNFDRFKHDERKFIWMRNLCFFSTMWFIGCRPKESYAALISDVDLINDNFFINGDRNKTRKTRIRKIPFQLKNIFIEYIKWKIKVFPNSKFLFPSIKTDSFVTKRSVQKCFQKILKKINLFEINYIDKKQVPRYTLNLYSFRKGHATYLYEKTGDPYLVQKSLDHLHIETTCKFYIKTMPEIINQKILSVFNQ